MNDENQTVRFAGKRVLRLVKGINRQCNDDGDDQLWREDIATDLFMGGRGVSGYWVDTQHGPAAIREGMIAEGLIEVRDDGLQRLTLKGLNAHLEICEKRADRDDASDDDIAVSYMVTGRIGEMMWDLNSDGS